MPTARMDFFDPREYQAGQNVEAPTTAPSTGEESLLVDDYDYAHRPPSNESTDLSTANSPFGSDKSGGHWNMQPNVPVQYAGISLAHRVRPLHPNLPWPPQDESQYGIGQSMPSMPAEGSFPPPQPYQDTINNDDVLESCVEHYDSNRLNTTFVPPMSLQTYGSHTNVRPTEQQLSTSYPSLSNTLERSSSGNKRKRVGQDQWQPVGSPNNISQSAANPTLPVGHTLTRAGEQILAIWLQAHQRMPNSSELLGLSVVTEVVEPAVTYWLSCNRSPPFHVPETLPIPSSSRSSSNNVPTTPTPTASSRKNTCNVKKRVPKPWNKAWDDEKPYSCLCRCGWTFTKKGDWIKHEKINFPEYTFHCPVPDCRSNFGRKDKCRDHIRKVHKIMQTQQFDLDSRRTSVVDGLNDRCGFCGHICTSWQEWYDHVGAHFENRIEGGPWTMSMWRYPWIDDAEASHGDEGPDDGNDPDNNGNDDSEKGAEHETDDPFYGYGARGPSHGSKRGGGDSGDREPRSGGGRTGFQHMATKYCTGSSQPSSPSAQSEALKATYRTNSMPQLNQQHTRRRAKKQKKQNQLKINHPITWPLTEEQAILKVAPGSSLRTERINPLVDLAVAGKSARDAHIAELAPYLEDKAQVVSQSSLHGKPDEAPTQTANLSAMNVSSHMDVATEGFDDQDLLDRIDNLIGQSVGERIGLPQLLVRGDQPLGKITVFEAITRIPFPKKILRGTRFATQVTRKPKDDYSLLLSIDLSAERSLSRRVPNEKAQVPVQRCSSCDKEFKRPCDLTKHEKAHSRPWKCENEECKYHVFGWPTEKERDCHMNDKHFKTHALYKCLYPPCAYHSEGEGNFKQHMEITLGLNYARFQNNGWNGEKLVQGGSAESIQNGLWTQEPQITPTPLADLTRFVKSSQLTVDADRVRRRAGCLRETRWKYSTERHKQTPDTRRGMRQLRLPCPWVVQEKVATNNIIIAVIGSTGVGKSSFIRSLSGVHEAEKEQGVSAGIAPGQIGSIQVGTRRVMLIDTPGFDDSEHTGSELLAEIAGLLAAQYQSGKSLNGILFLHPTRNSQPQRSLRNLSIFRKLCGDSSLANVVLATTMWKRVNETVDAAWEKEQLLHRIFNMQDYEQPSRQVPAMASQETAYALVNDRRIIKPFHDKARMLRDIATGSKVMEFAYHLATNEPLAGTFVRLGPDAATILTAAVRTYSQDQLRTGNHSEEAGDDGGTRELVLGGNSLEQELRTVAGSPIGGALHVSRNRPSLIGTREQDAGGDSPELRACSRRQRGKTSFQ